MGMPPYRIDILQTIDGVDFDEAWHSKIDTVVEETPVHVISSEMLIRNKLAVGRPRDLLDVEEIRASALEAPAADSKA